MSPSKNGVQFCLNVEKTHRVEMSAIIRGDAPRLRTLRSALTISSSVSANVLQRAINEFPSSADLNLFNVVTFYGRYLRHRWLRHPHYFTSEQFHTVRPTGSTRG